MSPEAIAVLIMFLVRFVVPVTLIFALGTLFASASAKTAR
jgi:hypothetical protein